MSDSNLLKQILEATRNVWDQPGTRPAVRKNFRRGARLRDAGARLGSLCFRYGGKALLSQVQVEVLPKLWVSRHRSRILDNIGQKIKRAVRILLQHLKADG